MCEQKEKGGFAISWAANKLYYYLAGGEFDAEVDVLYFILFIIYNA